MTALFDDSPDVFASPTHLAWLAAHREALLDFYQPAVCLPTGGYAWLDDHGAPLPKKGAQLWLGARMIHIFSVAHLLGRPGAAEVVEHGLDFYVDGAGRDHEYGGWFPIVGGDTPDDRKELYGIAQLVLAGSSATAAGFSRGPALMQAALDIIDEHFWLEEWGRCAEGYDRSFSQLDEYRGQNANMHLTEAYLAAHQVTGNPEYLSRATRIASHIAGRAANRGSEGAWRLPEHFDPDWNPIPDYNIDDQRHPFRPYGSQIGHWLEWSKLLLQIAAQGVDEQWVGDAAEVLFDAAVAEGWLEPGGFIYTVDWDGRPVVAERYFWEPPEAMGAARLLWLRTGDQKYADWYRKLWEFCDRHFIDHERGSWYPELDSQARPITFTWEGKADLYHVYQGTLYALMPANLSFATWARSVAHGEWVVLRS